MKAFVDECCTQFVVPIGLMRPPRTLDRSLECPVTKDDRPNLFTPLDFTCIQRLLEDSKSYGSMTLLEPGH